MDTLSDDLDAYLADEVNYDEAPEPAPDADTAERSLHTLRWLRDQMRDVHDLADRRIQLINSWAVAQLDVLQSRVDWHEAALRGWHQAVLADDPKRKTIHLPSGTLRARAGRDRIDIEDEDAFVEFARLSATQLLRVRYDADKKAIAALSVKDDGTIVTDDGEVLPGVTKRTGETSYTIDTEVAQ